MANLKEKKMRQRGIVWFMNAPIPKDVQPAYAGKKAFEQTLKTDAVTVARDRRDKLLAMWQQEFEALRESGDITPEGLKSVRAALGNPQPAQATNAHTRGALTV